MEFFKVKKTCLLVFLGLFMTGNVLAAEHIVFEGSPITLSVHKDIERQIVFPKHASIVIGVRAEQLGGFKTLSSVDNRVFIQASDAGVKRQKIIFKDSVTGTNFVFDIKPSKDATLDPLVNIHLSKNKPSSTDAVGNKRSQNKINSYPFLTRYVFQHVYSPERLVKDHPLIQRVSVESKTVRNLFGCFGGSTACTDVSAKPIVSYRTDRLYASAIEISNTSSHALEVDARMILRSPADLLAASFMHHRLHHRLLPNKAGNKSKTIMVLIHKRPLREFFYEQEAGR